MSARVINADFRDCLDLPEWTGCFVISDPPYNQGYHYSEYRDRLYEDEYANLLRAAFSGRRSVIIHYPEETVNLLGRVVGTCEEVVSWVYPSNTQKQSRLVSWWGCRPDMTKVGQEYRNPTDKRIRERIERGETARLYDWWEFDQVKNVSKSSNPHPCPIPYQLALRIILTTTEPGDVVVDPFCGSGTILAAASDSGRVAFGFDVDAEYAEYAAARLFTKVERRPMHANALATLPRCQGTGG